MQQLHLARFFRKNSCCKKTTKNDKKWPKDRVFPYFEKIIYWFSLETTLKWYCFTVLIPYLGKLFFVSYNWKAFQPIRLQDSLITYLLMKWLDQWFFTYRQTARKVKKKLNKIFLMVWSGMPKAAHNRRRCSKASQELQFHWK